MLCWLAFFFEKPAITGLAPHPLSLSSFVYTSYKGSKMLVKVSCSVVQGAVPTGLIGCHSFANQPRPSSTLGPGGVAHMSGGQSHRGLCKKLSSLHYSVHFATPAYRINSVSTCVERMGRKSGCTMKKLHISNTLKHVDSLYIEQFS